MNAAKTALESVARAMGEKHNIRVIFRGNECCTNGKTIYLPMLTDKSPAALIEKLRGYLDHEVGHIIFSDFSVIEKRKPALEAFALNAIEDIWIERQMEKAYKGCVPNFRRSFEMVFEWLKGEGKFTERAKTDPVAATLMLFISVCRQGWHNPMIAEFGAEYVPVLEYLEPLMTKTEAITCTQDSWDLAKEVLEAITEYSKVLPKEEPEIIVKGAASDKGDGPAESGTSEGSTSSSYSSDDFGDDGRPGSGADYAPAGDHTSHAEAVTAEDEDEPEPEPEDEDEGREAAAPESAHEGDDPEPAPEDEDEDGDEDEGFEPDDDDDPLKKALREDLEDEEKERDPIARVAELLEAEVSKTPHGEWRAFTTEHDTFEPYRIDGDMERALERYESCRSSLGSLVGVLKNQLLRILLSKKRSRFIGGKRNGWLNPGQIAHVVTGTSDAVFRHRHEGVRLNTAVSILVDQSGSMGGSKIQKAKETTILLAETLSLLGVPFEILGFSGDHSGARRLEVPSGFSRWGSVDMFQYKSFDEAYGKVHKARLASMKAHRENYDGESVLFAARRLKSLRNEPKKVLFVLSDGYPAAHGCASLHDLHDHLIQVVRDLERDPGFFVCGFGILTDAPKAFYRNHLIIDRLEDLPKKLIESLYRALVLES